MDTISLLKTDHRKVECLFKAVEVSGDKAHASCGKLFQRKAHDSDMYAEWFVALKYLAARGVPKSNFAIGLGIGVKRSATDEIIKKLMDFGYIESFGVDHYVITAHGTAKVKSLP